MKCTNLLVLIVFLKFSLICAQIIDETFHEPIPYRSAKIRCIKSFPDGKIIIGGDITFNKDTRVNNLIILNKDGSIDETFRFVRSGSFIVDEIELQNNGDIIVLIREYESLFEYYTSDKCILLQLSPDGTVKRTIDTLYNVNSIALQDNDKILVCGNKSFNGYLYRFNNDLSPDISFNNHLSFNNEVFDVMVDKNKLFVAGRFSSVDGLIKNDIVKLNLDGTIDTTFNTGSGTDDIIGSLTLQNDGKILLGQAYINSFNGKKYDGMVRLNPDGSVDKGFDPPYISSATSEFTIKDSAIFVSAMIRINSLPGKYLFKLKSNGRLDLTFKPILVDKLYDEFHFAFSENDIVINNSASTGDIYGLSRYDSSGNKIKTFFPEVSRYGLITTGNYFNGKLVIAGDFMKVDGIKTFGIARLNNDGSVDTTFILSRNMGAAIQVKVLNDTSILVSTGSAFFKLNNKAAYQPDFNFKHFKTLYQIIKFRMLEDRKIISGDPNNIFRLNADGTEDSTFNIGSGICCIVSTAFDFDLQSDKIIYGSKFIEFNGTKVNKLIRLNSDASVDQTFNIGKGPDGGIFDGITMIKTLDNGEIIVGGSFHHFNEIEVPHGIVKLSKSGTIDMAFNKNQKSASFNYGLEELMYAKVEQVGTKIFIKNQKFILVLNIDGTVDNDFNIPFLVNQMNDIIALKDSSQNANKKNSATVNNSKIYLYALGAFRKSDDNNPSFLIKLVNWVIPPKTSFRFFQFI